MGVIDKSKFVIMEESVQFPSLNHVGVGGDGGDGGDCGVLWCWWN